MPSLLAIWRQPVKALSSTLFLFDPATEVHTQVPRCPGAGHTPKLDTARWVFGSWFLLRSTTWAGTYRVGAAPPPVATGVWHSTPQ